MIRTSVLSRYQYFQLLAGIKCLTITLQLNAHTQKKSFQSSSSGFGLQSLVVPTPCQADVLYEQLNYICVKDEIRYQEFFFFFTKVCTKLSIVDAGASWDGRILKTSAETQSAW